MIEFFVGSLYGERLELNLLFDKIMKENQSLFNKDYKISALYGSFENSIWNGGRANKPFDISYNDIKNNIDLINQNGISVNYTFTNSLIKSNHLNDKNSNKLMELANNGMNGVIVASEILHKYLKEKYPNFHYVYSTTKCSLNLEDYDNDYDISVLDYRLNKNIDFLNSIKDKSKIEILVDDCCPSCKFRKQHFENVGKYNLGEDIDISCLNPENYGKYENPKNFYESLLRTMKNSLTYEEVEEYKKMGFNKFKLTGRSQGRRFLLDSYIYYFVKPEFRHNVKSILQLRLGDELNLYDEK